MVVAVIEWCGVWMWYVCVLWWQAVIVFVWCVCNADAIRGFNIVNRVPHDPMHVFLEGVLKLELYLCLHWFAKQLGWGVTLVDEMIAHFPYQDSEKCDKPAKIAACHLGNLMCAVVHGLVWCVPV